MGPEEELLYRAKCYDEKALSMLLEAANKRIPKQLKSILKVSYDDIDDAIMIILLK